MRKLGSTVLALGCLWLVRAAHAQSGEAVPDFDLLEYLGSWQADDDEWLAIVEWDKGHANRDDGDDDDATDEADNDGHVTPPAADQRNER